MERFRKIKAALAVIMFVFAGFAIAAVLTRGADYVIAQDLHAMVINDPMEPPARTRILNPAYDALDRPPLFPERRRILGEYSTEFSAGPKARNANIKKAAEAIDNVTIGPGETFSYNDTLGPTTKENGYQRARIFVRGTKSYGYGGGVCQVSSTLYNAVLEAGLFVTERHSHSLPVQYVPRGKDAATSYGSVDFKFINTLSAPVEINASVSEENTLLIQIVS